MCQDNLTPYARGHAPGQRQSGADEKRCPKAACSQARITTALRGVDLARRNSTGFGPIAKSGRLADDRGGIAVRVHRQTVSQSHHLLATFADGGPIVQDNVKMLDGAVERK